MAPTKCSTAKTSLSEWGFSPGGRQVGMNKKYFRVEDEVNDSVKHYQIGKPIFTKSVKPPSNQSNTKDNTKTINTNTLYL